MSWKKSSFASSLLGLLGEPSLDAGRAKRTEAIRQAMLDCLLHFGESEAGARVRGRVIWTRDIPSLWYLRSDVMTLLAGHIGESAARERIQKVTDMFNGLLPVARGARMSRLGR